MTNLIPSFLPLNLVKTQGKMITWSTKIRKPLRKERGREGKRRKREEGETEKGNSRI